MARKRISGTRGGSLVPEKGIVVRAQKNEGRKRANEVYDRLLTAGKRLMKLIEGMKGATNKEIARLTDQINALYDKFK